MAQYLQELVPSGLLPLNPKSVYINCPFDHDFTACFEALILATVCCGFAPRSPRERESTDEPLLDRILSTLPACQYSIHDLSRCHGRGPEQLARFNMPLELGMAAMLRSITTHDCLVLVLEHTDHAKFISDIDGSDLHLKPYNGTAEGLVSAVMSWFRDHCEGTELLLEPEQVPTLLRKFRAAIAQFQQPQRPDIPWWEMPWEAIVLAASSIIENALHA